jgi:WD40 repeat protein
VKTGKEVRLFQGHTGKVAAVAYSADGKQFASGGYDGVVILWNLATSKELSRLKQHKGIVTGLAFSPDGKRLVSGGALAKTFSFGNVQGGAPLMVMDDLLEWDLAKRTATRLPIQGTSVAFSADGKWIAAGGLHPDVKVEGKSVSLGGLYITEVLDLATRKRRHQIKQRGVAVVFSPDGKILATAAGVDHLDGLKVVQIGPSGRDIDRRIRLWEPSSGKERLRLPQDDASAIAFSPDGKLLAAGSYRGALTLWDLQAERHDPTPDPLERAKPAAR